MEINGQTKLLGLIGNPTGHSYSPQIHNYISDALGVNYAYAAMQVEKDCVGDAIRGIRALNFCGINVTAPYKADVIPFLDYVEPTAAMYGSVNTIANKDGKLCGYNTDADGFYASLKVNGIEVSGKDILIFGAGGACRPVCIKFFSCGAKSITVLNRSAQNAEKLKKTVLNATGREILLCRENEKYDVVINTTSLGMHPNEDKCPADDFSFIGKNTAAVDMIYNPARTLFLKKAALSGADIILNGLDMLIFQGIFAYEIFTGIKIEKSIYTDIRKEVFGL